MLTANVLHPLRFSICKLESRPMLSGSLCDTIRKVTQSKDEKLVMIEHQSKHNDSYRQAPTPLKVQWLQVSSKLSNTLKKLLHYQKRDAIERRDKYIFKYHQKYYSYIPPTPRTPQGLGPGDCRAVQRSQEDPIQTRKYIRSYAHHDFERWEKSYIKFTTSKK